MTTNTTRLFQYIHMTEKQEQLSLLYLQTKEEEILKDIQLTTIRDQRRGDFAERFINDFRKVHKQDPAFLRLFYYLLGEQLLNVLIIRFKYVDFSNMKVYLEKSALPLDQLVVIACKYLTNISSYVNEAYSFLKELTKENPNYIERQLHTLLNKQQLSLLLVMFEVDYERFHTYSSLLEERLKEHAEFILNLNGEKEKIEATERYIKDESDRELFLGGNLPDYIWRLLFHVHKYSNVARRYVEILAKKNVWGFINHATCYVCQTLNQPQNYKRTGSVNKKTYNEIQSFCKQFWISEERFFAHRLRQHDLNNEEFCKAYEYEMLCSVAEENPEFVQRTLQYISKSNYLIIARTLAEKGHELNRGRMREEFFIAALQLKLSTVRDTYRDYLLGKLSFDEMKQILTNPKYRNMYWDMPVLEVVLLWDIDDVAKREAALTLQFGDVYSVNLYELLYECSVRGIEPKQVLEELLSYGLSKEKLIAYAVEQAACYSEERNEAKEALVHVIVKEQAYIIEQFDEYSAVAKAYILEELAKDNMIKMRPILIKTLGDSSKKMRESVIKLLSRDVEAAEDVALELHNKKKIVRENVMKLLIGYKIEKYTELVQEALQDKKNASLAEKFAPLLEVGRSAENIEELCGRIVTEQKRNSLLQLIGDEPQIRLRHSNEIADATIPLAYLRQYISDSVIEKKEEVEAIGSTLNEQDLKECVQEIYQTWISQDADVKKRGILSLYGIYSDDKMVGILKKQIDEWVLDMRGKIAADAVRALGLSSSKLALMSIHAMAFKYKHKQVRNAAKEALSLAAKTRSITEEELEDQLVPNLGFNIRGEKEIDFGNRCFTAILTAESKIELETEEGKRMKSLPKPNAKDDIEKAELAKREVSTLKKELRSALSMQKQRLEAALSRKRYWSYDSWKALFLENPIMKQFATSLIWGEYTEGKLLEMFRYAEDGMFYSVIGENHEFSSGTVIGFIHPLELSETEKELWKEQLEHSKIVQPFLQMERPVFVVEENDKVTVERFGGILLNGRSLFGKMTKLGWIRGSVQDGGVYYTFYKEDTRTGLGAQLSFSGAPIGYEDEEDICVYDIEFYKAGTVNRGSYEYDEIDDKRRIVPKEVDKYFFSEILYDVQLATDSNLGHNESWRNKR
ncbi:DUF4132 domain-containing protein [Bacillus cereus]|uniref:DUF4132 domain-containing protein n=1 Tax=Bacillus TaxID=1386 RepID=UPI000937F718|nr:MULTISPECIES: DUF4132 domain-containing protein [Bacillus cereus group]PFN35835.1 DUF4132 domain-containing protein [Bacillus cereus]MCU5206807.1 DUF4132 domain-containing protein [Bacillus paranthracis]MDA2160213.1 DUF4132 domain-containing protein [Bacillus cereus group sp. Bc252]MDF9509896.1 DUF4132 domain-containing protein [Bacillus paranthracis]MDF9667648.1 DUF4132 domain-containing protein [Bacillus paranthracis]